MRAVWALSAWCIVLPFLFVSWLYLFLFTFKQPASGNSMKRIFLLSWLAALGYLFSCHKEENVYTVGVDVQSAFNQDSVQVWIDGQKILDQRLQTNYTLGVCYGEGQRVLRLNEGEHEIKAVVNNQVTGSERFTITGNLFIGVNFDPSQPAISFLHSANRFIYD